MHEEEYKRKASKKRKTSNNILETYIEIYLLK